MAFLLLHGEALLLRNLEKTCGAVVLVALVFYLAWRLTGRGRRN